MSLESVQSYCRVNVPCETNAHKRRDQGRNDLRRAGERTGRVPRSASSAPSVSMWRSSGPLLEGYYSRTISWPSHPAVLCLRELRRGFPSRLSKEPCYNLNFWRQWVLWSSPASPSHFQGSELFGFCRSREQWGPARYRCGHVRHQVPRAITVAPLSIYCVTCRVLCVMWYATDGGNGGLIKRSSMQLVYLRTIFS